MRKLTLIIALLLLTVLQYGCSWNVHGGIGADAFYPDIRTKDGGGFGDPDKSRHEIMRSTRGSTRNNDGNGNATDRALRSFFNTKGGK